MTWFRKVFSMLFDTKTVKDLRQQKSELSTMVALAKKDEAIAVSGLRDTLTEAQREAKYRPSALASGFGWRRHG